jgi:hypothetical protein
MLHHAHIKPREMHQLHDALIRHQPLQIRAIEPAPAQRFRAQLNQMRRAIARR